MVPPTCLEIPVVDCGATDVFGDPRFGATGTLSDLTITSFLEGFAFLKIFFVDFRYHCSYEKFSELEFSKITSFSMK